MGDTAAYPLAYSEDKKADKDVSHAKDQNPNLMINKKWIRYADSWEVGVPPNSESENLPGGYYSASFVDQQGKWTFNSQSLTSERHPRLCGNVYEQVHEYVDKIFDPEYANIVDNMGYNLTGGVLLYGRGGTGKSTILTEVFRKVVEEDETSVGLLCNDWRVLEYINTTREMFPRMAILLDDVEIDTMRDRHFQNYIKKFLDSPVSASASILLLTTNCDVRELPDTLIDRPSRFGVVAQFEEIHRDTIESIVMDKAGDILEKAELQTLVDKLDEDGEVETVDQVKHHMINYLYEKKTSKKTKTTKLRKVAVKRKEFVV